MDQLRTNARSLPNVEAEIHTLKSNFAASDRITDNIHSITQLPLPTVKGLAKSAFLVAAFIITSPVSPIFAGLIAWPLTRATWALIDGRKEQKKLADENVELTARIASKIGAHFARSAAPISDRDFRMADRFARQTADRIRKNDPDFADTLAHYTHNVLQHKAKQLPLT